MSTTISNLNLEQFSHAVGEQLSFDAASGMLNFEYPCPLPSAGNKLTPSFSLSYQPTAANTIFGRGWSASQMKVTRKMKPHFPLYQDDQESDVFIITGIGELAPLYENGQRTRIQEGNYTIYPYQGVQEGHFSRIERWQHSTNLQSFWKVKKADNSTLIFGQDSQAQIHHPTHQHQVFEWLLSVAYNDKGQAVVYQYKPENAQNINQQLPYELGRTQQFNQKYLKQILYGNTLPYENTPAWQSNNQWLFEMVLDYGEHALNPAQAYPTSTTWEARVDAFSSYQAGFEIRTYRKCRRLLFFTHLESASPFLQGAVELQQNLQEGIHELQAITYKGYKKEGGNYQSKALPPLEFQYAHNYSNQELQQQPIQDLAVENVPAGVSGARHSWIDLYQEGISGILVEYAQAWYYKSNYGEGIFGELELVNKKPSNTESGHYQLTDWDNNGQLDCLTNAANTTGYYEQNVQQKQWENFQTLDQSPVGNNGYQFTLDVDGEGLPDLLQINHNREALWYNSKGKKGYEAPQLIALPEDLPLQMGHDQQELLTFADMTGDGLQDLVVINNGRVQYWPHLGHGQFGSKVEMQVPHIFDNITTFDVQKILLLDITGTGTTDIAYLDNQELQVYANHAGNSLELHYQIEHWGGQLSHNDNLTILDIMGNGTQALVWSSSSPHQQTASIHYLPLSPQPPHLLEAVDNNLGRLSKIHYTSSVKQALAAKRAGNPWHSSLAYYPIVVEEIEEIDWISGSKMSNQFTYRDGYYDGKERQFRGFAYVEQVDTEQFEEYNNLPTEHYVEATLTKTWFYNGLLGQDPLYNQQFLQQQAKANGVALPTVINQQNSLIYLNPKEEQEAYLLLDGKVRRQEIHRMDKANSLVSINQQGYVIKQYQNKKTEQHKATFAAFATDSITYACDGVPLEDARISHQLPLTIDQYGAITESCSISYGRQHSSAYAEQATTKMVYTTQQVLHQDQHPEQYALGIGLAQKSFEIAGLDQIYQGVVLDKLAIQQQLNLALAQLMPQGQALDYNQPQAQLLAWNKTYYSNLTTQEALPFGQIQFPILEHHQEQLVGEETWVQQTWQGRVSALDLEQLNYKKEQNNFWRSTASYTYYNKDNFYLPHTVQAPTGNVDSYKYDNFGLFIHKITNSLGQEATSTYNYQALAVAQQVDWNDNTTEFGYDALHNLVAMTHYGQELDAQGQVVSQGHQSLATFSWQEPSSTAVLLQQPQQFLQGITAYFHYDLWAWKERQEPLVVVALRNENYEGHPTPNIQISLGHVDGFGRPLQSKMLVEEGKAWQLDANGLTEVQASQRWVVSGRVLYNNKQQPIKQYEPFYSVDWQYEAEASLDAWGEASQLHYDALGRVVKIVSPRGTFEKTIYTAWQQQYFDANDTIKDSLYYTIHSSLPNTDPSKQALQQMESHYNTPTTQHLDNLGRPFLIQKSSSPQVLLETHTQLDLLGNVLQVTDARGVVLSQHSYDLLGQAVYLNSADAGEKWSLYDNAGLNTTNWTANGEQLQQDYDLLGRPTQLWLQENGQPLLLQQLTYGNSLAPALAKNKNALGQVLLTEDATGRQSIQAYNIAGLVLEQKQELCVEYKHTIDWSSTVALEPEQYTSRYEYDALGRVTLHQKPDGSQHIPQYLQSGRLYKMQVQGFGANPSSSHEFLQDSSYNARGQLVSRQLGNQVSLQYTYDSKEFRLQSFKAIHQQGSQHRHLQWNNYHYDAVGNITHLEDHALAGLLNQTSSSPLVKQYHYDAHYRLIAATGKIHQAFNQWDGARNAHTQPIAFKGTQHLTTNNSQAVENYTRRYHYDAGGNLQSMQHLGQSKNWTRNYWIAADSNRSLSATDYNGNPISNPEQHFDAAGNLVQLAHLRSLEWNCFNQLQKVVLIERLTEPDDAEYYVYNSGGLRSRKITERLVNGRVEITEKIYLDGCEIIQKKTNNNLLYKATTTIVQAEGQTKLALIHHIHTGLAAGEAATTFRYQIGNHLGAVALETDEQGQIISYEEYFPFGGTAFLFGNNKKEVARKTYRYSGKEKDDATGFYYYGFRYYVPWLCRWLNPDPTGMRDGPNIYAFVQNNPINLVDAWGLDAKAAQLFKENRKDFKRVRFSINKEGKATEVFSSAKHGTITRTNGDVYRENSTKAIVGVYYNDSDYSHTPLQPKKEAKEERKTTKRAKRRRRTKPKTKKQEAFEFLEKAKQITPELLKTPPSSNNPFEEKEPLTKNQEKKQQEKREEKDTGKGTAAPQETALQPEQKPKKEAPNPATPVAPPVEKPKAKPAPKKEKENSTFLDELAKDLDKSNKELGRLVKDEHPVVAGLAGVVGGLGNIGTGTIKTVDTATDFLAFWGAVIGEGAGVVEASTTNRIAARLDKKIDPLKQAAKNPLKTAQFIKKKAGETLDKAWAGDGEAIYAVSAFLTELGVGLATGQAAKSATPLSAAGKLQKAVKKLEAPDGLSKKGLRETLKEGYQGAKKSAKKGIRNTKESVKEKLDKKYWEKKAKSTAPNSARERAVGDFDIHSSSGAMTDIEIRDVAQKVRDTSNIEGFDIVLVNSDTGGYYGDYYELFTKWRRDSVYGFFMSRKKGMNKRYEMELAGPKIYLFKGEGKGEFGPMNIDYSRYTLQHELFHAEMYSYVKGKVRGNNHEDIFNAIPNHIHEEYVLSRLLTEDGKWGAVDLDIDFRNLNKIRKKAGLEPITKEQLGVWDLELELHKIGFVIE